MKGKILAADEVESTVSRLRSQGKKIVSCNGAFDILHAGHVRFLREAKEQGDILVVGLNSDSSIKRYKDPKRPVIPQDQRAEVLAALECVDYVTIFDEETPIALLEKIRPDVHVNGAEYGPDCIEAGTVKRYGGRIHLISRLDEFSTTKLIERIIETYSKK